jgi:hypothetical protein
VSGIEAIADLIDVSQYRDILHVLKFELPPELLGAGKEVFVFSHNTPRHRILGRDFGNRVVLFHNQYMTSFLDNIALVLLARGHPSLVLAENAPAVPNLLAAFARKFFAEQLYILGDSGMARTLFLETIIAYDRHIRPYFELRTQDEELRHASAIFTGLASDFLLHHEIAHIAVDHDDFAARRDQGLELLESVDVFQALNVKERARLDEEVGADIVGLELVIRRCAVFLSGNNIKQYLRLVIELVTRMEILYEIARDAYQLNVDTTFDGGDLESAMRHWQCRHLAMVQYLDAFTFGPETVVPQAVDALLPFDWKQNDIDALTANLTAPFDIAVRRVAETISRGFENGAGFDAVINGTRQVRVLDREFDY